MNTIQNSNPSSIASVSNTAPRHIGIHIALPPLALWTIMGVEIGMLSRLLSTALNRRKILIGDFNLIGFDRQVLGLIEVSSLGMALSTISAELSAVKLITGAHLAWVCDGEDIWRTDIPLPEPMPFSRHIEAFLAWDKARLAQPAESWSAQATQFLADASHLVTELQKRQASQSNTQPGEGAL